MAFLIGIWGHERRIYAAVKFVLYTMAGSILMLVGIIWLYNVTGSFDLPLIQQALATRPELLGATAELIRRNELLLFLSFFFAFAIKVPLFPLHTWLPDAHVEAPTAGSVMLAGVLLKMGTYGMMRFCLPLFPNASRRCAGWIAVLAIIGIIYGALVSLVQPNLKKLVAYSSVSHLGFVVLGIFALHNISLQGAVYQMLAHGISTGALFLLVGMLYDRRHTFEITQFGGLATPMPQLAAFFLFIALASAGLPMLNGFVGEFLILLGTYALHAGWASWAATGVILSACYLLWAYQRVFFGEVTVEKNKTLSDVSMREKWILLTMAVVTLWMGLGSAFITRRTQRRCRMCWNKWAASRRSRPLRRSPLSPRSQLAPSHQLLWKGRNTLNDSRPEDLIRVLPETVWCLFGVLLMLMQPFTRSRAVLNFTALLGSILGTSATIYAYTSIGAGSASAASFSSMPLRFSFTCSSASWRFSWCSPRARILSARDWKPRSSTRSCCSPPQAWGCLLPHRNS
jgi:proton-translocating NADH-quinone oxidoreductase chain M